LNEATPLSDKHNFDQTPNSENARVATQTPPLLGGDAPTSARRIRCERGAYKNAGVSSARDLTPLSSSLTATDPWLSASADVRRG